MHPTMPQTTQPPTSQPPTTMPPTTQPPTTMRPTTQPLTTMAPTTQPPTTNATENFPPSCSIPGPNGEKITTCYELHQALVTDNVGDVFIRNVCNAPWNIQSN